MKIAFCLPEIEWVQQIVNGNPQEAAVIQQQYISCGLAARGHNIGFFAPQNLRDVVYDDFEHNQSLLPRTWSVSPVYNFVRKVVWNIQKGIGVPYLNFFSNYSYSDAYIQSLRGYDLILERVNLWGCGVAMACAQLKLPYILFFDADQIFELDYSGEGLVGLQRWRAIQILKYNLKTARYIICVSDQAKSNLVHDWRVGPGKVVVYQNGVDVERFTPLPEAKNDVRQSLGIPIDSPVFIFVGNFFKWHDVSTLVDAFALVLSDFPQARLLLVGDGVNRPEMIQKAEKMGISDHVVFTGFVPHEEIPRMIAAADIAVVPYPNMSQGLWMSPMKLFEYMASGKAVIASDIGQIAEVIQDGHNGLLVSPGDCDELANALVRLVKDENFRIDLAKHARLDAERKYSWDMYIQRLENLFLSSAAQTI